MYKILEKLVGFNTINDKENKEIMDYIESYLKELDFKIERIGKCLVAKNSDNPKIGFLGHTDTFKSNLLKRNSFSLKYKENKIYGLGVCDMKGGIAAILSSLKKIDLSKTKLALYFTYDEEKNFKGIKELQNQQFPEIVIVGEPTNNIPVIATKGLLELKITFKGKSTHASNPEKGINAIYKACNFINKLKQYYKILKKDINSSFDVPYTSMNVGLIKGGEAINSVPERCSITIDFRIIKEEHLEEIISSIKKILKEYSGSLVIKNQIKPKIFKSELSFLKIETKTANYITEGSFIDTNIIILGPGPITAHEKDEYITKESLKQIEKQYISIIKYYTEEIL